MKDLKDYPEHIITGLDQGSVCEELGIEIGDALIAVNNNKIVDFVDYDFFSQETDIRLTIKKKSGDIIEYAFEKDEDEPLGLLFESYFMDEQRSCRNKCIFCFIDQMPKNMRKTLYFKDDDWRLSLVMGNYMTFTNVSDAELERIIERRVSPIYVSVHATDEQVRAKLLGRGNCNIMPVLKRLCEGSIIFHCQIVLCPGVNDGKVLEQTLNDLYSLGENCASVAVVPVGITKFRQGLYKLDKVNFNVANETLNIINSVNEKAYNERGKNFAFASDEIYITAKRDFPCFEFYGDFEQIEDGIGMCRMFEREFLSAAKQINSNETDVAVICGTLVQGFLQNLLDKLPEKGARAVGVVNEFFGDTITVTGLLTGQDIINHIKSNNLPKHILIATHCLKHGETVFLDDITLKDIQNELNEHIIEIADGGYDLVEKIRKN